MLQLSVLVGFFAMIFSLLGWVAICDKLHRSWDFATLAPTSLILGIGLGCGLYALLARIKRSKRLPVTFNLSLEETANRLRDALLRPIKAVGYVSEWTKTLSR
jgi:hypothetical protein